METLTITLPLPPAVLNPNSSRVHWRRVQQAIKSYREAGYIAAMDAVNRQKPSVPFKAVTLQATFYFKVKRRRDGGNFESTLKPAQDGLVDAGVIVDDDYARVTNLPPILKIDRDNPRVELVVTETKPEATP